MTAPPRSPGSGAVAAIDLGATSGRVVLGTIEDGIVGIEVLHRFANVPTETPDGLHWNVLGLFQGALDGLAALIRDTGSVASIGIDSWGVDYGLMQRGRLLGNPFHYRDERNGAGVEAVHQSIGPAELYQHNGLQFLPFNSLYQLTVDLVEGALDAADGFLLIPDLFNYWLTGEQRCEATNASTTGLLSHDRMAWDSDLAERLGLPLGLLPPLIQPGELIGPTLPHVTSTIGAAQPVDVVTVGSHDPASAVAVVPMEASNAAYISCGTWGLVGVEVERPIRTEESRAANFTNEGGVDGRVRFLHNVTGLWLLNESIRTWESTGESVDLESLLGAAQRETSPVAVFDANDAEFLPPGDMPQRIADHCRARDLPVPATKAEYARSIVESLAAAFAAAVRTAAELSGVEVRTVHLVGGGSLNALLCQLTADRVGLEVLAGPVEATAIGNVLVQARAAGHLDGDLDRLRTVVASSVPLKRYSPRR
ncbi:MAG: rhamnulokinase [Acidimicrobiales bacterium]